MPFFQGEIDGTQSQLAEIECTSEMRARGVLLAAVESGPDAAGEIDSIQYGACAALYALLVDHPVDQRRRIAVALRSTPGYHNGVTERAPHEITQRELRNDSGEIMRAVERGESFTITRNGTPIGRLIPLRRRTFVPRQEVMAAFATAPVLEAERFRADIDDLADQDLLDREW
jgi:prevent-host-death family protein